jgi:hypothetical protein
LGGSYHDNAAYIEQTPDNGFIVSGVTYSNDGDVSGFNRGLSDIWIVKLSPNVLGTGNVANDFGIEVYPNPSVDKVNVRCSKYAIKKVELYNGMGEKLSEKDLPKDIHEEKTDLSRFAFGFYIINVITEKGTVAFKISKIN